jgi:hypothetical protein
LVIRPEARNAMPPYIDSTLSLTTTINLLIAILASKNPLRR